MVALTTAQIGGLTSLALNALTTGQLGALSSAQIRALTTVAEAGLTTAGIAALTTMQIAGLSSPQIGALSLAQVAALSSTQISALTSAAIPGLTTAQVSALSTTQVKGLISSEISALTTTQIRSMTQAQIAAISASAMPGFATAQLNALTTTQVAGLTAAQMGGAMMSVGGNNASASIAVTGSVPTGTNVLQSGRVNLQYAYSGNTPVIYKAYFVKGEDSSLLNLIGWNDGRDITSYASVTSNATSSTITIATGAGIANGVITINVAGFIPPWNAVSLDAMAGVGLNLTRVGGLAAAQMSGFSSAQITALTTSAVGGLTNSEIAALTTAQIAGLTSSQISSLTLPQLGSMTQPQVAALTTLQKSGLATVQAAVLGPHTITGTASADTIIGAAYAETITVLAANDTINGFAGADTIDGGAGNDTLVLTATSADLNSAADAQLANVETISAAGAATGVTINLRNQTEALTIVGGPGADLIAGSTTGANIFDYSNPAGSLVANYDTIIGVKASDQFKIGHTPLASAPVAATVVGTGSLSADLTTALAAANFIASAAAVVSITGTGAGSFLVLNDGTAGFQSGSDAVIKLVNPGTLTSSNFIA